MRQIELLHSLSLSNYVGEVRVHVWGVESEFWGGITFGMQMNISVAVLCASACVFGGVTGCNVYVHQPAWGGTKG